MASTCRVSKQSSLVLGAGHPAGRHDVLCAVQSTPRAAEERLLLVRVIPFQTLLYHSL